MDKLFIQWINRELIEPISALFEILDDHRVTQYPDIQEKINKIKELLSVNDIIPNGGESKYIELNDVTYVDKLGQHKKSKSKYQKTKKKNTNEDKDKCIVEDVKVSDTVEDVKVSDTVEDVKVSDTVEDIKVSDMVEDIQESGTLEDIQESGTLEEHEHKKSKSKMKKTKQCTHILTSGKRKGELCNIAIYEYDNSCLKHSKHSKPKCIFVLLSGKRKGEHCNYNVAKLHKYTCPKHAENENSFEFTLNEEKYIYNKKYNNNPETEYELKNQVDAEQENQIDVEQENQIDVEQENQMETEPKHVSFEVEDMSDNDSISYNSPYDTDDMISSIFY